MFVVGLYSHLRAKRGSGCECEEVPTIASEAVVSLSPKVAGGVRCNLELVLSRAPQLGFVQPGATLKVAKVGFPSIARQELTPQND